MLISLIFSYLFLLIEINSHLFCPMDYILLLHYHLPTFVAQIVPVLIFRSSIKLTALSFKHACSVAQSCPQLWPHRLQYTRLPYPSLSPTVCSNSYSLSWLCNPNLLSFPSPLTHNLSQPQDLSQWVTFSYQMAKVLDLQHQHQLW